MRASFMAVMLVVGSGCVALRLPATDIQECGRECFEDRDACTLSEQSDFKDCHAHLQRCLLECEEGR